MMYRSIRRNADSHRPPKRWRQFTLALLGVMTLGSAIACGSSEDDPDAETGPIGQPASNAAEAWPKRATPPAPLSTAEVIDGCAALARCALTEAKERQGLVSLCIYQVEFSAERAIPFRNLDGELFENAEYVLRCAIAAGDQCSEVDACQAQRSVDFRCEEAGCSSDTQRDVACAGNTATITDENGATVTRDCTTANATCDTKSPTGCTDRPFTTCGFEGKADRCDGNIRLGCDGAGQVSFRDCARLGGTCETDTSGVGGCVYPDQSPRCDADDTYPEVRCEGDQLVTCVTGREVKQAAPGVCPG